MKFVFLFLIKNEIFFVFVQIVRLRESRAPYLLPSMSFYSDSVSTTTTTKDRLPKECFFSQEIVVNALETSGHDISRFERQFPSEPGQLF